MDAIRLDPDQIQQPYSLMTKRTGTGDRELTIEISCHADRRAALDALYDHIHLMTSKGFTCERVNLLRWKSFNPLTGVQCAVWIAQTEEVT